MKNGKGGIKASNESIEGKLSEAEQKLRVLFNSIYNHQSEVERIQLVLLNSPTEKTHGVPCGGWNKDISSDIHNVLEEMSALQSSFLDTVKSVLAGVFDRKHFGITQIRDISRCFLYSYRTENNRFLKINERMYDCFDDATLERIANLATAIYLEEWLRKDRLSHQSIENFAAQPYIPKKRLQNGQHIEGNEIIWPKGDCVAEQAEKAESKKVKRYTYIDEPYDVIENSYYIDNIYPASDYRQSTVEASLHSIRRTFLQDLILFLNTFYPPAQQRAWKPVDFSEAVEFYRSAYPVIGTLSQTSFPSINKTQPTGEPVDICYVNRFYGLFRDVYTTQDYDTSYLRKAYPQILLQHKIPC